MTQRALTKRFAGLAAYCLVILAVTGGCGPSAEEAKERVDAEVYRIIDRRWDAKFGLKTNFKVSDTEPAAGAIQIDKSLPDSGMLTLEHTVALATAHNRQYQTAREDLYLKALDLKLIRYEYELQYFGKALGLYTDVGDFGGLGAGTDFGFEQLLATGARIGMKITTNWMKILTGEPGTSLVSILTAEITQPLLRGRDRRVVMERFTQAERDTLYQIRTFNRYRKEFVIDIISRYYRILEFHDNLQNAEENYRALKKIYGRMETLSSAGKLPQYELQQAHQDRLEALDTYVQARKVYEQALDKFKIVLSIPATTKMKLDSGVLKTLVAAGVPGIDFDEDEAIATALSTRLDLANVADAVIDAERHIVVAADALGMELNLSGRTDIVAGESRTGSLEKVSEVILVDRNRNVNTIKLDDIFTVGLDLDFAFDRVTEEDAFRRTLIAFAQSQRTYEEAMDSVGLDVRQAYRNLIEARERYLVQSRSLKLARQRVDNTFLLLQYSSRGNRRANTRDVLDAQEDLFRAQNDATGALVDYNIAVLEFYRDAGVLQVKPDGMWRKATAAR